jgi:hypothetical protein
MPANLARPRSTAALLSDLERRAREGDSAARWTLRLLTRGEVATSADAPPTDRNSDSRR